MKTLVTGVAGFIGFHVARSLLARGETVVGLDNINEYYDPVLKHKRLEVLGIGKKAIQDRRPVRSAEYPGFTFIKADLQDRREIDTLFESERFDRVCHLAAQAGVRYSLEHPHTYVESNVVGFLNILEACRRCRPGHLVYASSSSVYGLNRKMPFSTADNVDHPISLYAATKKSNELMAHCYSHLYGLPTTGLRFFTVYGPWGRPDMALFKFTRAILAGEEIEVYNHGDMIRDFTYIDDAVEGVVRILNTVPQGNPAWDAERPAPDSSPAPFRVYNIGNNKPVRLLDFITELEKQLGRKAAMRLLPMQPGDVPVTIADVDDLEREIGYHPSTPVEKGIAEFVRWYLEFYHPKD